MIKPILVCIVIGARASAQVAETPPSPEELVFEADMKVYDRDGVQFTTDVKQFNAEDSQLKGEELAFRQAFAAVFNRNERLKVSVAEFQAHKSACASGESGRCVYVGKPNADALNMEIAEVKRLQAEYGGVETSLNARRSQIEQRRSEILGRKAAMKDRRLALDERRKMLLAAYSVSAPGSCGNAKYSWYWARACSGTLSIISGNGEGEARSACEAQRSSRAISNPKCSQASCAKGCGSAIPAD